MGNEQEQGGDIHPAWIAVLVVGALVAIVVGVYVVLKPKAAVVATTSSQPVESRNQQAAPSILAGKTPATLPSPDAEKIQGLLVENEKLRAEALQQIEADRIRSEAYKVEKIGLLNEIEVARKALASSRSDRQPDISIDPLKIFAKKLAAAIQADNQAAAEKDAGKDDKITELCGVAGVDLKKTDSLVNPVVGQIILSTASRRLAGNGVPFHSSYGDQFVVTVTNKQGKFSVVSITRKCTESETWNNGATQTGADLGKEEVIRDDAFNKQVEEAQK